MDDSQNPNNNLSDSSLESADTVVEQPSAAPVASSETLDAAPEQPQPANPPEPINSIQGQDTAAKQPPAQSTRPAQPKMSLLQRIRRFIGKANIYVLLFILILIIAGIATFASYRSSNSTTSKSNINGQTLSAQDLQNLKNNNTTVGDATETLTIASNSIFNGQVLVKSNLDVAGTIRVGGALSLPGITVSGTSAFDSVQIGNNLSIAGNAAITGALTIQKSISVSGNATFSGVISAPTINIDQLILNKDLQLNRHIEAGGQTPHVSSGTAVGGGGTVSLNGSDTSGTVNINFGSGPPAGILANISFINAFNQTPHVVITPVGSSCANLNYYVNRGTTSFSIGTTNSGTGGTSCSFDYFVVD
ncbi:MAG TPA: hypothetical protein VMR51_02235 [Patescibacteria group bacterium]|nr:hypothetical protein [Patescibacteria group bacterium]